MSLLCYVRYGGGACGLVVLGEEVGVEHSKVAVRENAGLGHKVGGKVG